MCGRCGMCMSLITPPYVQMFLLEGCLMQPRTKRMGLISLYAADDSLEGLNVLQSVLIDSAVGVLNISICLCLTT